MKSGKINVIGSLQAGVMEEVYSSNVGMANVADSYTKLLLHFTGADAATTIYDATVNNHVMTAVGSAQLDTAQRMFGTGASLLLNGSTDYVTTPDSADFYYATGNFVIDFWVRFNALPTSGNSMAFVSQYASGSSFWWCYVTNQVSPAGYYLAFETNSSGAKWTTGTRVWTTPVTGQWYHIAIVRTGNVGKIFVDGTQVGLDNTDTNEVPDVSSTLQIGAVGGGNLLDGWIDELRISKGTDRGWTGSSFTIPTVAYTGDDPAKDVAITGLAGDTAEEYELEVKLVSVDATWVVVRLNSDSTNSHYQYQQLFSYGSLIEALGAGTTLGGWYLVLGTVTPTTAYGKMYIFARSGRPRACVNNVGYSIGGTTVTGHQEYSQMWTNTADELTRIDLIGTFGVGSYIRLLRKVSKV